MNNEQNNQNNQEKHETVPPAQEQGYTSPVQPPIEQRRADPPVRRIGTLTMGFALIATGLIALISTFNPGFDVVTILKLSPILFVFLGIEILANSFFYKGAKLKYDFLSGFVCFLLICGALCVAVVPTVWEYFGPHALQMRSQLEDQIEDDLYKRLQSNDQIRSVSIDSYLAPYMKLNTPYMKLNSSVTLESVASQTNTYVSISLKGPFEDHDSFAQSSESILSRIKDTPYDIQRVNIYYAGEMVHFELNISDRFQLNMDAQSLAQLVDISRIDQQEHDQSYEASAYEDTSAIELPPPDDVLSASTSSEVVSLS